MVEWGMSFTIKLRRADILYSKWLRKERGYICERCNKFYEKGIGLQCSHFYGRAAESVRFDPRNTDVLCAGCHQYFSANPAEYVAWKKNRMGDQEFARLTLDAHITQKRDDNKVLIFLSRQPIWKNQAKELQKYIIHWKSWLVKIRQTLTSQQKLTGKKQSWGILTRMLWKELLRLLRIEIRLYDYNTASLTILQFKGIRLRDFSPNFNHTFPY